MRRHFALVAVALACGCGPADAPKKAGGTPSTANLPRVVFLMFGRLDDPTSGGAALVRKRLTELGHVEGANIRYEDRYGDGDPQLLAQRAREIVAGKPDVIVTIAAAATLAVRHETDTIPIVMAHAGNPVDSGLVHSLAHPGGNVTGTTSMVLDLGEKQVDLLRQLVPGLATVGMLANPTNPSTAPLVAGTKEAARRFGIDVVVADVASANDIEPALAKIRAARPGAMFVMMEPLIGMHRTRLLEFAATNRIPASFDVGREQVRNGGLVSYGPSLASHYVVVAEYVDRILKGAKPADLPVQLPTEFALVINLKTASALGLTVPQAVLMRADEVIR